MTITPAEIIDFWFSERVKKQWLSSTEALDKEIRDRYQALWRKAAAGELDDWQDSPLGSLALVIIMDQFPLNMFRNQATSFSMEQKAVEITCQGIETGQHQELEKEHLSFLFMPLMHSEDLEMQDLSVKLYREHGLDSNLKFAEHHRDLIKRFGRFPHRNRILGRTSTIEEERYLQSHEAFLG
ncbi:DUF924 family protein [Solemya velesiana gill symbiont]|uniref:DUF924 domain-containing protein n=1 Tax=Solemya velesiana gill symbiont TaxID=1918948 RepID=A0A1T2KP90_9GAMM|nr:DUF924 family protein [Solemya velesiana gill symbiont]OOZ34500.1 hypothetical protein BOW51_12130 [Solemya velesiana gill symbiont]